MNSFLAIYNQSGIACASDTDNTIYRLSKEEPVAIAICPYSPIPWECIITQYLRKGEPEHHKTLEEYARDFETFFQQFHADKAWNKLGINELNLIFLGYGQDEIYPSVCDIQIVVDEETEKMKLGEIGIKQINLSRDDNAGYNWNGNFERLASILFGATEQVKDFATEKQFDLFHAYKQRVIEKFKGTQYEEYVNKCLSKYPEEIAVPKPVTKATTKAFERAYEGISTFSIEELVSTAETLVNANVRLLHLKEGGKGLLGHTREIAVLTRAEGFTWIKHSLFAI